MAVSTGNQGFITFGGSTVVEIKSWTLEENAEQIDTTTQGATSKTSLSGIPSASGTISVLYDPADATQESMSANAIGEMILYPL